MRRLMLGPRTFVAASAIGTGLVLRYLVAVSVSPVFFWLVIAWFVASLLFFGRLVPPRESSEYRKARFVYYIFELGVAALAAGFLGLGAWLAIPFVLFPALEWSGTARGRWDLIGGALAGLAAGLMVASEAYGVGVPGSALTGVELAGSTTRAVLFGGLAALLVFGLSAGVGRLVAAEQSEKERLRALNEELEDASEDLRDAHKEIQEAYAELQTAQAELVNSARLATLGTLVAGVAHELNTPLGAINSNHDVIERALNGLQEILEDEVVTPDELVRVRRIVRAMDGVLKTNGVAVGRMVDLVDNLRTFGRPDRADIDRVDLHEGIEGTLAILAHRLRGMEIEKDFEELPPVQCYPNRLNQVFMNLLLNARQSIPGDEGKITIRTRRHGDEVRIEIRDTGSGIAPENLDRIFEPGFTTKGARMGMGLGLLIVKQIVDQHRGEIEVDSVVGKGTTFTLRLPVELRAASAPALAGSGTEPSQPSQGDVP